VPACLLFEGVQSGAGQPADWALAGALAPRTRLLLAGGLDAQNVYDAIKRVRPWGVDVSSGVESAPGRKSPRRIYEFVKAARVAFEELSE
jgi:phosphoribosylanthranilate isomerase